MKEAGASGRRAEGFPELLEGGDRGLLVRGHDYVISGGERKGREDGAQAAADAVTGHGVAYSFPDGVPDAVVSQAVGPHAQAQEPMAHAATILQYRDEVLTAAKPFGAREGSRRLPEPR